ncbi:MAG: alkaline phosphatase D family protein [Pseudobdellovibrionaceae bacterium]|nr:alkaline phosphatase D family protein [Pseudobdellovibrionaceae bacterium]
MLQSRRRLFQVGGGLFGSLIMHPKSFSSEILNNEESKSRRNLEQISTTFAYGVASGDPLADRVILWTHVTGDGSTSVNVRWQAALDLAFTQIVAEGDTSTTAEQDFTVKVDALLPYSGTTYYYRFSAMNCWSMIGRTRTAPSTMSNIRLALVSCSSIWSGYFNTYEALARRSDMDAILHVGDYIYDFVDEDEQRNMPSDPVNTQNPDTLAAVRQRYRYYRRDPFLRHAHQQHPGIIVWDNHDIDHAAGKADSIRAFHEWVPIRSPEYWNHDLVYRRLSFGPMLDLIMLDTRHIGRDAISHETGQLTLLGDQQFQWLKNQLTESQAHWRILGNQVLMAPCKILGKPISESMWDGYPADRQRVLQVLVDHGIKNTLIATGDAHLSFAANLEWGGRAAAVEILPSSVTRGNLDEQVKGILGAIAKGGFAAVIKLFNPHIRYFESTRHGYGIIDLKEEGAHLEFWYVPHEELSQDQEMAQAIDVASGQQRITQEKSSKSEGVKRASLSRTRTSHRGIQRTARPGIGKNWTYLRAGF